MKKYIDFDKIDKKVYLNYYLEDVRLSIKIPVEFKDFIGANMKFEKFSINYSIYLTDF